MTQHQGRKSVFRVGRCELKSNIGYFEMMSTFIRVLLLILIG